MHYIEAYVKIVLFMKKTHTQTEKRTIVQFSFTKRDLYIIPIGYKVKERKCVEAVAHE